MADEQLEASVPTFADLLAISDEGEKVASETFSVKGKKWRFTIRIDGMQDAARWTELLNAQMYGQTSEMIAKLKGERFAEKILIPSADGGKIEEVFVTDPTYLGGVKLLSCVLVEPAWSFSECLVAGRRMGKVFTEICQWAADANGISEHSVGLMREALKNAQAPAP